MATCTNCGNDLPEGAFFCQQCGQKVSPPASAAPGVTDPSTGPLYEVHTRQYFRRAWEIFKSYPAGFLGFTLILLFVTLLLGRLTKSAPFLGFLVGPAIAPLQAGLYIVSARLLQGRTCRFEDFFSGFRYLPPLLIFGLIWGIVARLSYFFPDDFLLRFFCHLISLAFMLIYFFTPLLIIDRRLGWWEAMQLSQRTVQRRWLAILGFLLFGCLVAAAGFLALIVGSLVTVPLFLIAITVAYADLFGLQSQEY